MKRLALGLLLLGCGRPTPSSTPLPTSTSASPPAAVTSPTPGGMSEIKPEDIIKVAAQHTDLGLSVQARIDLLMAHMTASGKKRLVSNWDVFPEGVGTYEVTYSISSISKASGTPTPTPTASATPPRRPDPFARPQRPKPSADAINLTWLVDPAKGTCLPKDDRTRSLLALQPRLDDQGLEGVLPEKWRAAAPKGVEDVPVGGPDATPSPTVVATPPRIAATPEATATPIASVKPSPQETPDEPEPVESPAAPGGDPALSVNRTGNEHADPIKLVGYIGNGKERRAIFSQGKENFEIEVGGRFAGYRLMEFHGDELVLRRGQDTTRLIPGQVLSP